MTLTVPSAISVNVTPNGTLVKSSASSFSAKTDGAWGYNLSIKAKSTTDMVNGSAKLSTISKTMPESEYTAAGNNNSWGFIPSKLNSNANSSYIPASTGGSTIEKTSAANASAATSYNITLGAKADNNLAKGTYSNTMVLTLSANTVNYSITYNLESGTWNGKSPQSGSTTTNIVKLDSNKPTRANYEFKGWCSVAVTSNSTASPSCSGKTYQPGDNYTLSSGSNAVTLHAMWKNSLMQGWNGCNNLSEGSVISLIDSRDSNIYSVAKLKDKKCWMIDNLKLVGPKTLTPNDSNIISNFSLPANSNNNWGNEHADANYSPNLHIKISGGSDVYYSYSAAIATTDSISLEREQNASTSICPKGWKLPSGGVNIESDFNKLAKAYGYDSGANIASINLQAIPSPHFTLAGMYTTAEESNYGVKGTYWSSTSYGSGSINGGYGAYFLGIEKTSINPIEHGKQYFGRSIRCFTE